MNEEHNQNESVSVSIVKFVADQGLTERRLSDAQFAALKELIFARFNSEKEATQLAYHELQRRLEVLNHNHEEMEKRNAFFLPRENFEQFFRDFGNWRDGVNNFQSNLTGRIAVIAALTVVAIGLLFHYWR